MDTPNLHLFIEQILLKKSRVLTEQLLKNKRQGAHGDTARQGGTGRKATSRRKLPTAVGRDGTERPGGDLSAPGYRKIVMLSKRN